MLIATTRLCESSCRDSLFIRLSASCASAEDFKEYLFSESGSTVFDYLEALSAPNKCIALPSLLSPLGLVMALARERYIAEAAYVHWSLLAMPSALYRSDTACELLNVRILTVESRQLPGFVSGLAEVFQREWGWNQPWE